MLAVPKLIAGGLAMIVLGLVFLANPDLGWYPPTVFIGVGALLFFAGVVGLLGPPGFLYSTRTRQRVWKTIFCGQCSSYFAYPIDVCAGFNAMDTLFREGDALANAQAARARFEADCDKIVVAVPCPVCGWYQANMWPLARKQYVHWAQTVGWLLLACALAVSTVAFDGRWLIAGLVATGGVGMIVLGMAWRRLFDPNAGDSELRKRRGQALAIWGERFDRAVAECKGTARQAEKLG